MGMDSDNNMITLPLTCKQIVSITAVGLLILGVSLLLQPSDFLWASGFIILLVLGLLGLCLGLVELTFWLPYHVRCKCSK